MATPNPEKMITGTGDGGATPEVIERSAAGDIAGAIAGRTDKKDMGFLVKCIGIALILLCIGAATSFIMYGGIFFKASASAQVGGESKEDKEGKGLPPRLEIRKEIVGKGASGNTADGKFSQTLVIPYPPIPEKNQ